MNKVLVFAVSVMATGLLFSCTSDIESAEDILKKASSSSEQGVSSSNTPPSSSSSSMPSGSVLCLLPSTCTAIHADVCSALGGIAVQSCPANSSSSALLSSSSSAPPSSSSVVPSSSSAGLSSSSVLPSSSSVAPSSSSATLPSSSSEDLCAGFVEGTEREHYGKMKKQFCDEDDGKKYVYVVIGTQTWMAENLNYNTPDSKCYDNLDSNCEKYGRLYNWERAMVVCPAGWHLPSREEWEMLGNDAYKLKTSWNNDPSTDDYGFSALPGGGIANFGREGYWWSANEWSTSEQDNYRAYALEMYTYAGYTSWFHRAKSDLLSVRCLQD